MIITQPASIPGLQFHSESSGATGIRVITPALLEKCGFGLAGIFPVAEIPQPWWEGVVILVSGGSMCCLSAMRHFAPQGMDLRRDQCNSSSRWDKPHSPPALPGVLFPSLHHLFPPPLQPSHHHLRQEKLSVLFNLLPTVPESHNLWGRLENAQLGTAGGVTAGNSTQTFPAPLFSALNPLQQLVQITIFIS